jgi:putative tricarboxylic transport membrane protein
MMGRNITGSELISYSGCIIIGLVGIFYGYQMMQDDALVGLVPLATSTLLVLFASLSFRAKHIPSPENAVHEGDAPRSVWIAPIVMVALILFLFLINILGFMLDTAVLILVIMTTSGVRKVTTIAFTLIAVLGIAFLFQQILGIELPRGMI